MALALSSGRADAGRPLQTEDTSTVEPGDVELITALEYLRVPGQHTGIGVVAVTVGLTADLDAQVEVSGFTLARDDDTGRGGFAKALVGVKYRLLDETEQRPAVLAALTLAARPTATLQDLEGVGPAEDGFDLDARVAVSKVFGPFTVTWNGGYGFTTSGTDEHGLVLGLAGEYRATKTLAVVAETFSVVTFDGSAPYVVLRVGAMYTISDRIRLDGAVGAGLTRNSPDVTATVGVTLRF